MHQRRGPLDSTGVIRADLNLARFAAIADIHGNRWALEAVLEDIEHRGIRTIVNLGDHLFGPLDPDGTAALLMRRRIITISGNQDRELLEKGCAQTITAEQRNWLAAMPAWLTLPDVLLVHGTHRSDTEYLTETVHPEGARLATPKEISSRLPADPPSLLLCGHTHMPRVISSDDCLIVNPGSVGLQAYVDDLPYRHQMETGSPHARYAILERTDAGWNVKHVQLVYDWSSASLQAGVNRRIDWAYRLTTGRAR